jgi:hypothetical protein
MPLNIDINKIFDVIPKDDVQVFVNDFLKDKNVLGNPVDVQNELERLEKYKELQRQERRDRLKLVSIFIVLVGGITALWFVTQKVKK